MPDPLDRGITVTEIAPKDQPINPVPDTTAAFVGRALRGPLDTPVLIRNFAQFRRRFGGFWPGSSLGTAVDQYFSHGGRKAWVIRVANNARGAMLCLPALHGVLVLRAVEPGSAEQLRAAVDYDGIAVDDESRFNLTLQRVAPDTGLVLDQEIYRSLTCDRESERNVADVLLTSALVRAQAPVPVHRPMATGAEYVDPVQTGTDGLALSDYDLVGSAVRGTGMFALDQVDQLDLLYLPPPEIGRVPGPAAILAAELYCRKRGAMLILDPPETWQSSQDAVDGVGAAGYANPDVIAYFPRARLRGDRASAPLAIGGAIAGLLSKLDRTRGPWEDLDQRGFALNRSLVPGLELDADAAHQLVKHGINVVAGTTPGHTVLCGSVTLAYGSQAGAEMSSLPARRLCLHIANTIDRATRWAVFEADVGASAERIVNQVHSFMCALADAGAFENDRFLVQCDAGSRQRESAHGFTVLLAFRPAGSPRTLSLTLQQSPAGFRVAATAFAPVREDVA